MISPPTVPAPLPRPVFSRQKWREVVFLHWRVPTATVAPFFPPGTRPDEVEPGLTYVGLVPFRMSDVAAVVPWAAPHVGQFLETNVRLYSVDAEGRQGVFFCSMDAQRLLVVAAARALLGLPYIWSPMDSERSGSRLGYSTGRRGAGAGAVSRVEVEVGPPVEATELDVWLTARWGAHARAFGRTWWIPNAHETWPLHEARALAQPTGRLGAYGVEPGREPDLVRFSPGVSAQFGRPLPLARG